MAGTMVLLQIALLSSSANRVGKFDFEAKATAVGPLIERLAAQTGTKLKASAKIAKEIVFVRAKGVELGDLKTKLADALMAEWKTEGGIEYLNRPSTLDRKIWNDHVSYRRKLVDEAMVEVEKQVAEKFDGRALAMQLSTLDRQAEGEDRATSMRRHQKEKQLFAKGPLARLANRLLLACNRDDLAAIGSFERRVFRIKPTRMQRGFDPKRYEAAIEAFATEQQAWIDEAAKFEFPQGGPMQVSDPRIQLRVETKLEALSLVVARGEMTSLFMANLISEGGGPYGYNILTQVVLADPGRKFLDSQIAPKPQTAEDPLVELSPDSQEFRQRTIEAFRSRQPNPIGPAMKAMMLGVEQADPLGWVVSDGLDAWSKFSGRNLVAVIPDGALSITMFVAADQPLHTRQFRDALVDSGTVVEREVDGWTVMSPADRYEAALEFSQRNEVAALMRSVFDSGRLDIRDYARYAFRSKLRNRGGLADWFLAMNDRSLLGASDHTVWRTLQLYGSLSPAQQKQLEAGDRIRYSGMNPDQAAVLERIVYGERLTKGYISVQGTEQSFAGAVEPTDAFPNGVPAECYVSAKVERRPVIVAYGQGSDGVNRPLRGLDPLNLAAIETDVDGNPEKMAQYGVANLVGYAPGKDLLLNICVEPAPNIWDSSSVTMPDYDPKAKPVRWDKLPEPLPKQIAAAIEQYKARKANQPGRIIPPALRR